MQIALGNSWYLRIIQLKYVDNFKPEIFSAILLFPFIVEKIFIRTRFKRFEGDLAMSYCICLDSTLEKPTYPEMPFEGILEDHGHDQGYNNNNKNNHRRELSKTEDFSLKKKHQAPMKTANSSW